MPFLPRTRPPRLPHRRVFSVPHAPSVGKRGRPVAGRRSGLDPAIISSSRLVPSRARRQSAGEEEDTGEEDEDILLDMELAACVEIVHQQRAQEPGLPRTHERHCASTFAAPPSPVPILLGSFLSSLGRYLSLVLIVAHIPVNALVKKTSPKKYCVQPNNGIVAPRSSFVVLVTIQAQREAPLDMQCRGAFLVQSAVVSRSIAPKDISGDLFTKESGNMVNEVKLKVVYAPPLQPASINEGSD